MNILIIIIILQILGYIKAEYLKDELNENIKFLKIYREILNRLMNNYFNEEIYDEERLLTEEYNWLINNSTRYSPIMIY